MMLVRGQVRELRETLLTHICFAKETEPDKHSQLHSAQRNNAQQQLKLGIGTRSCAQQKKSALGHDLPSSATARLTEA